VLGAIVRYSPVYLTCMDLTSSSSFRILITGGSSGLVETITDAVSIHSIKKAEYARRSAGERLEHVTLMDHFKNVRSRSISKPSADLLFRLMGTHLLQNLLVPNETLPSHWPATP
jgi:hypothetical protein